MADVTAPYAWVEPFLRPGAPVDGAGNYNRNFIVPRGDTTVVVRVPITNAELLDFRAIPETAVLAAVTAGGMTAPRLLHADPAGRFAVHSFIPGQRLDQRYPVRAALPDWVALDLAAQLARLHALDPAPLQPLCATVPASPHSAALLQTLLDFTERSVAPLAERHAWLYRQLRIPPHPLDVVRQEARRLPPAPFTICHCDVHRRNLLIDPSADRLTIIDWELALVADPALDLGIHLHRMRYQPHQEALFLSTYLRLRGESSASDGWRARIESFRRHEQVRSALVDVTRAVEDMRENLPLETRTMLAQHYAIKLARAWEVWGVAPDAALLAPEALLALLDEAGRRASAS